MLFVGHSGTGSCPVFGVGKAVLLPLIRSLKNRSWRTALHARRKENVFGKWIFSFQGSKRKRRSSFWGRKIKKIGTAAPRKKYPSLYTTFFGDL